MTNKRPQVYYHAIDSVPGWETITREQLDKIHTSGLIDVCDLHINCHYNINNWQQFKQDYLHPNITWHTSTADPKEFEHPTYILMKQHADATTDNYYALYIHQKGITHTDIKATYWRWYLDYFNITRWQDCITLLDTGNYDTCGVQRSARTDDLPTFYEGNRCWYTSQFLRRAKPLQLPSQVGYVAQYDIPHTMYRSDVELWAWHNNDRWYSFHHTDLNLYCSEYPPDKYEL